MASTLLVAGMIIAVALDCIAVFAVAAS